MTEKELREIKRRFRPERSNIPRIVGCFVNGNGEILSNISQSIGTSDSVVSEKLLAVMKKTLSGTLGTNLTEINFSTRDVTDGAQHKLLMKLRESELRDEDALKSFYAKVIESVSFEGNYVILLANDIYDVFTKKNDGEESDSSERFSYVICAVCPIKNIPEALTFKESDSLFHTVSASGLLGSVELGFMFPLFDDRKTNIYGSLYYTRSLSESYPEFTENIFGKNSPMPPRVQKATFNECLAEAVSDELSFEVVRSVHTQIAELVESHKESHDPEPLVITKATVKSVLEGCGVAEEKIECVGKAMDESFGEGAELSPKNIVDTKKFELTTPDVTIKVNPEHRDLVSTQIIGGVQYIMIRATEGVEVNGINIKLEEDTNN